LAAYQAQATGLSWQIDLSKSAAGSVGMRVLANYQRDKFISQSDGCSWPRLCKNSDTLSKFALVLKFWKRSAGV